MSYLFGLRRGDVQMAGVLAAVYTLVGYGYLAFPEYRSRWSGPNSRFWYPLVGVLAPVAMFLSAYSPLLSGADTLPLMALVGGLWLGGVHAGVALDRASADPSEGDR